MGGREVGREVEGGGGEKQRERKGGSEGERGKEGVREREERRV